MAAELNVSPFARRNGDNFNGRIVRPLLEGGGGLRLRRRDIFATRSGGRARAGRKGGGEARDGAVSKGGDVGSNGGAHGGGGVELAGLKARTVGADGAVSWAQRWGGATRLCAGICTRAKLNGRDCRGVRGEAMRRRVGGGLLRTS